MSTPLTYTTPTLVIAAFPWANAENKEIVPEMIETAVDWAQAEVKAYIAGRYALPLANPVPLLTRIATDLAIYFVWTARPFTPPPRVVETAWPLRYQNAIALLVNIQAGQMALVDVTGVIVTPGVVGSAWSSTMNYQPTFADGLDDRISRGDPDKEEAAKNSRYWIGPWGIPRPGW